MPRPTSSPIGNPPVAAPSIGSPDMATDAGLGRPAVASSSRSRALASRSVAVWS